MHQKFSLNMDVIPDGVANYTYQPLDKPSVVRVLVIQPADDLYVPL